MRRHGGCGDELFSFVRLEERVPADHPLRAIRALTDEVLASLCGRIDGLYARVGRPSIPPEMLLRATLLQAFFSIRSERMLMEQINYNLLFRWFVGLSMDAAVWHPTGFTHNRDRLLEADVAREFLSALMSLPKVKRLLSSEHFSVDGTLIDAWASMKSVRPKDGSGVLPVRDATASATSVARSAPTRPMPRPPIRMPGSIARRTVVKAGCATWAMRSWRTAMAWSSMPA
ncbi:hypothetical protein D3C72_1523570 [compost metagenome]